MPGGSLGDDDLSVQLLLLSVLPWLISIYSCFPPPPTRFWRAVGPVCQRAEVPDLLEM